jgi:hypothetical protein
MFRRPTKGLLNPTLCKRWAVVCLIHRAAPDSLAHAPIL